MFTAFRTANYGPATQDRNQHLGTRYTRSFTSRRVYSYTPQLIWSLITSEKFVLADWVLELDGPLTAQTGFSLSVRTRAIPGTAFTGHFDCQLVDVQPNERLAFMLTSIAPSPRTFRGALIFSEQDHGTGLSLTLSGFDRDPLSHVPVHDLLENALEHLSRATSTSASLK
ncbi:MAG: SRPBCC family protein [Mycobacterium sp.]